MSTSETPDAVINEEYHSTPVPLAGRLGFGQPAWVWSGFGIAFICAVIGGTIQQGLGTVEAILAIIAGNVILFVYASALGYASGKWGLNFPLTVRAVFGGRGSIIPIVILAALVTGWFSFHTWLTADIIKVAFTIESGVGVALIALAVGVIYAVPVIFGIKSMALVRQIAIPAMVLFVVYYLVTKVVPAGSALFESTGDGSMSFLTGVGIAWATYAVSGTMTGDIVRYTRTGGQAVGVTAVAFLFSNAPFMILGALFSAAIDDPTVPYFLDSDSMTVLIPLAAIAILSTWSTADACLYNAAMGFSNSLPGFNWRRAAILGMVLGIVAAMSGVIGNVTNLLIAIGLIVPPVGAVIISDYFLVRRRHGFGMDRIAPVNLAAIIAVVLGIVVGVFMYFSFPNFIFGIPGITVSLVTYALLAKGFGGALGAEEPTLVNAAEAEGITKPTAAPSVVA
ncbi:cytosine permease [Geodermatophilus sp. DSM 44513]|uniref:cytosine permease n=1 Tax=Geodermatophilus sp. DSM 44513 TaxID=1528104 RepID=UPI001288B0EB|nr:cytosine permease [Geodermatophilus sp. DSM 44513]WNV75208.1 cytosine permease [Geodermatophilus sp. DSM 44513]